MVYLQKGNEVEFKLGFIVESRYLRQNMPVSVIETLKSRKIDVDILNPVGGYFDLEKEIFHDAGGQQYDLKNYNAVISRNRNTLGLSLLCHAEICGLTTINTHTAIQKVRNKARMAIALKQAFIPSIRTFMADETSVLSALADTDFPLILKATYGDNSQGLRIVRNPIELAEIQWGNDLVLAQCFINTDGFDLKLYVIEDRVFAVRKPSPLNGDTGVQAQLIEPDQTMIDLALRCGELFDLDLYGVDTIEGPNGLEVIEVNDYPNYTGIAGAADQISDYILSRCRTG